MKHFAGLLMTALILVFLLSFSARAEYKHQFVGASKCRVCHMSKKKGDQYGVWKESKHTKAYETLITEEAKKAAEKAGKADKPPQENPACLKCHVAGWDAPAEMLDTKYDKTEGVSCEACHGPGKDYSKLSVMQDKELAIQNGLIIPKKEDCLTCHNQESPTYKPFDYDTFWPKIAHDNPETK
ncbi:MAG TPA: cytochrome c family protein [archaeon]|nr:cytochrome c family protein [archaeon]